MLFSIVTVLLAVADLAYASAAAATYCSEDNLLRAFQHTPTPASAYCTPITGYPTFLAVSTYPPSRLTSACSCFSRFPRDPSQPTPAPACTPNTVFQFQGLDTPGFRSVNVLVTIDPAQTCTYAGSNGFKVINVCGTYGNFPVTFDGSVSLGADNCYFPGSVGAVDANGVQFISGKPFRIYKYPMNSAFHIPYPMGGDGTYPHTFAAVACDAACPAPTA